MLKFGKPITIIIHKIVVIKGGTKIDIWTDKIVKRVLEIQHIFNIGIQQMTMFSNGG